MAKKKTVAVKDKAPKEKVSDEAELLDKVKTDFQAAWDYTSGSWHTRWDNNYKLYNNERVKVGYVGISKTFVPMTFSTVETMTSALFGGKPKFNFLPPRDKNDQKTDILNSLVDDYWERDQWSIKVINTGRSFIMRGTGVDYFCWGGDHPIMINVPLRDFFIDPTATSIENARYMGRRYLISKEELEEFEIVDLDSEPDEDGNYPMKQKYKNLDELDKDDNDTTGTSEGDETTDKEEKDIFYGSTLSGDALKGQVEVIEWWGRVVIDGKVEDRVISVANRNVVIENEENYFKSKARENGVKYPKALIPFAAARNYVDESLFYAKGDVDFIADQQEDLNDTSNQNKDAITYILNQMYTLDTTKTSVLPEEVENLPGAVYPGEANSIVPIPRGTIPPDAFGERMNIKNEIRETTATNEIVKGAGQEGGDPTATQINAQIAGAGQRINLKVTQIENEYFHRVARIVLGMVRLYVTEPMMVRIVGKDGARWEEFDPSEFADGEYEPRVQLDISIENQKRQDAADSKELLAAFLNDQNVNQLELKKMVLAKGFKLDPDEVELLMTPMPVEPQGSMPPEGMPPGAVDPMAGSPMGAMPPMDPSMMPPMPPAPMPEEDRALMSQGGGSQPYIDPVTGEEIPAEVMAMIEGSQ